MNNYEEALENFVTMLQQREDARLADSPAPTQEFTINRGRKYDKIVRGTSAFCFVMKTDDDNPYGAIQGDIMKAASWSSPARTTGGSIFDSDPLSETTHYGVHYLR
jgi:hypothetical protein